MPHLDQEVLIHTTPGTITIVLSFYSALSHSLETLAVLSSTWPR